MTKGEIARFAHQGKTIITNKVQRFSKSVFKFRLQSHLSVSALNISDDNLVKDLREKWVVVSHKYASVIREKSSQ